MNAKKINSVYFDENEFNNDTFTVSSNNMLLRTSDIKIRAGFSRATLYRRIAKKLWTKPVKLGRKSVAWPAYEVNALIGACIAEKTDEQIQMLVKKLERLREMTSKDCS